jgi:signal recognition particle subunit SRP54
VDVALAGVNKYKKLKYDMIIVDTSGRHYQEQALFEEMKELEAAIEPDEVIFVLDATIGQAAFQQAKAFGEAVDVGSIIITKLDSSSKGGGALSAVAATGSPIAFYGTGEGMTQIEEFEPHGFVSRMLGMGDAGSLARKIEEIDLDKQKEVAESIMAGHFAFRQMYDQYQTLLNMGDLSSLVDAMGMNKFMPKGGAPISMEDNVKRMLRVMDSMTDQEMDNPQLMRDDSRRRRIAAGSGMSLPFVQYVVDEQKRWAEMFKKMNKNVISRLTQMENSKGSNPKQMQQDLQAMARSMNPQMLRQLGGIGGLTNIMQKTWQAGQQTQTKK